MVAHFNVEICNTGAESPWQNGICERNHSVIDLCVEKIIEDDRDLSIEVALAWAVNAKNAISNYSGFSPYQLVLGQNPNLPSVLTDDLPALESKSDQDFVAVHLNALHAARKAYVEAETSDRIRRALCHKVRVVEESFELGDKIFYKRNYDNRWRGPAKVIGQDGKIVYVKHGDQLVRVSTCKIVKIGEEFQDPKETTSKGEEIDKDVVEENKQSSEVPIIKDYEQKKVQENLEHVQDPNQNQQKQSSLEHLDQNKQSNSVCGGGNMPRINDKIRY